ncbi:hypothetical protein AVEN_265536-1 [Araneus ventricosus]|uniref:Uncharacterized protein n=1 Tax=Araneus ventricosus TaxID=182803 RepID=A0A4Y2UMY3_ARAVE|nr:hypothetical protein AVEN_265536-1 [Araneus ventricosus]
MPDQRTSSDIPVPGQNSANEGAVGINTPLPDFGLLSMIQNLKEKTPLLLQTLPDLLNQSQHETVRDFSVRLESLINKSFDQENDDSEVLSPPVKAILGLFRDDPPVPTWSSAVK